MTQKEKVFDGDKYLVIKNTTNRGRYYQVVYKDSGKIKRLLSVTTYLGLLDKPAPLMYWSAKMACQYFADKMDDFKQGRLELNDKTIPKVIRDAKYHWKTIKDEAADVGTQVHNLVELYLKDLDYKTKLKESPEQTKIAFKAFRNWTKKTNYRVVETEKSVWDIDNLVAGTLDFIGEITRRKKAKLALIDFKTSKKVYDTHLLQLIPYMKAYEKSTGKKIEELGVLRLDKETGIPEYVKYPKKTWATGYRVFKNLVKIYHDKKKIDKLTIDLF